MKAPELHKTRADEHVTIAAGANTEIVATYEKHEESLTAQASPSFDLIRIRPRL